MDYGTSMAIFEHQLILKTYEPIYDAAEQGLTPDHWDRDRSNNVRSNLRWKSMSYQQRNRDMPNSAIRPVEVELWNAQ